MDIDNSYVDIVHNLEVSIIIPIYEDCNLLEYLILENLKYYNQNGVEIIVPFFNLAYENTLLSIIKKYYLINWRLIRVEKINQRTTSLLDVAIQYASKKYVLLAAIDCFNTTNIPYVLRRILNQYPNTYAIINSQSFIIEDFACPAFILVEKRHIDRINIRCDNRAIDLLNLSFYLDKSLNKIVVAETRFYTAINNRTNIKSLGLSEVLYPTKIFSRSRKKYRSNLGKLVYNWENNIFSEELCLEYLKSYDAYWIKDNAFKDRYEKIILCQSYNETEFITEFLENMGIYFDGIILLDDGSIDDTYEKVKHKKLLIKFKKKHLGFDDLENRNKLLDISSFFKAKWFCFMDIDERFDPRFVNFFKSLKMTKANNIGFLFIHLWDNPDQYNFNIQDCIYEGFFYRWRMFRNIGRANIITKQIKLHFSTTPIKTPYLLAPVVVHHLGNITLERRLNKYVMYKKEDIYNDRFEYEDLLSNGETKNVKKISKRMVNKTIKYLNTVVSNSIYLSWSVE